MANKVAAKPAVAAPRQKPSVLVDNHVILADGSVQELEDRQIVEKDGRWIIQAS